MEKNMERKTNFEKLKELKEFEVAQIIILLPMHVQTIQQATGADVNLDAIDLMEDAIEILTSWLKDECDERKGFKMYLSSRAEYITSVELSHYNYLEDSHNNYSDPFECDEE